MSGAAVGQQGNVTSGKHLTTKAIHAGIDFLKQLFKDTEHEVEIRFLPSKEQFFSKSFDEISDKINQNIHMQNTYFGCCTREGKKGTKQGCREVPALWIDIDYKDFAGGRDEVMALIETMIPPSVLNDTGNGCHGYWLLREPVEAVAADIEPYIKGLARRYGGDSNSTDLARVLRVPGTYNYKDGLKKPVTIIKADYDIRYNLSDFDDLKIENTNTAKNTSRNDTVDIILEGKRNTTLTQLAGTMRRPGMAECEIAAVLHAINRNRCRPPLPNAEVDAIAKSIGKYDNTQKPSGEDKPYITDSFGNLFKMKWVDGELFPIMIANFDARISEEIIEDNGTEIVNIYSIDGTCKGNTLSKIDVPANQFTSLSWLHKWGSGVIIEPGQANKDIVRHAIQTLSKDVIRTTCYTHTGWREISGHWCYLTTGGAIGGDGIRVKLSRELQRYSLPTIPLKELESIKASLSFIDVGNRCVTLPLWSFTYLSLLTSLLEPYPNFSGYIAGDTGTFKTTLAVLLLSHFGTFNATHLSNLSDTANALEKRAFTLKDAMLCIDDYHPSTSKIGSQQMEATVQKIIRSCSNRTGRHRLNSDSTEKGAYEPRGGILFTGEEIPQLQSTIARLMVNEIKKGDIDRARLTALQAQAHLLPHAMSSFIHWIRENMKDVLATFPTRFIQLRDKAFRDDAHKKLPDQQAFLQFALETVLSWMTDRKVISELEASSLSQEGWGIFTKLADKQNRRIESEDPVDRFKEILRVLIAQDKIKIEEKDDSLTSKVIGHEKGELIGYYDELFIYLLPPALWHGIQKYSIAEGTCFPFSKRTFFRMLATRGLIVTADDQNTFPEWIRGKTVRVLKFAGHSILGTEISKERKENE
ncbi:MAG: primase C-terminal domain-containing protein [Nitrospirae bacterium]|nr:primase C-terminal domain-containing protein [Nitrospirota bacterium]